MNQWYGPRVQLSHQQKPQPKPTIATNLNWVLSGYLKSRLHTPYSLDARETISGHYIHARSHRHLSTRQNLRKLRCRTHLLQWEPFPKPLVPKNPLKFINIGPFFALRGNIMMITPLTRAINRRNEGMGKGWNFGKGKEREREDLRRRKRKERERVVFPLGP